MTERARAWSIVALTLLCALLSYVLLRTPPQVRLMHAHSRTHPTPSTPVAPQPSESPAPESRDFNPEMYQGWPLFFGWPLPEAPSKGSEAGTGGSQAPH